MFLFHQFMLSQNSIPALKGPSAGNQYRMILKYGSQLQHKQKAATVAPLFLSPDDSQQAGELCI